MNHHPPQPARVRPGLQKVLALLVVTPSLAEVLAEAERLDLRDLSEYEISWLEGVSVRTVRGIGGSAAPAPTTATVAASDTRSDGTWSGGRLTDKELRHRSQDGGGLIWGKWARLVPILYRLPKSLYRHYRQTLQTIDFKGKLVGTPGFEPGTP
jgi:hypothetical protein